MDTGNESIRKQLDELMKTYDQAEKGIGALSDLLHRHTADVTSVSQDGLIKLEAWDRSLRERATTLGNLSDQVAGKAETVGKALQNQTTDMTRVSEEASRLLEALEEVSAKTAIDDFLHRATFISERLQSIAVDIGRIMEIPVSDDDWRRFNKGERGIFVRKMLGFREKTKLAALNLKYQEDPELREFIDRYVAEFEGLLSAAKNQRDREGMLTSTFLSADMGKLYMILARALGRDF